MRDLFNTETGEFFCLNENELIHFGFHVRKSNNIISNWYVCMLFVCHLK